MLLSNSSVVSPEIDRLIKDILREDARFSTELRSVHRQPLVCPVNLKLEGIDDYTIAGFSRNISSAGICLITDQPLDDNTTATLEIYRLKNNASEIVADCRWCKPFGPKYFMSGWQFVRVPRKRRA